MDKRMDSAVGKVIEEALLVSESGDMMQGQRDADWKFKCFCKFM